MPAETVTAARSFLPLRPKYGIVIGAYRVCRTSGSENNPVWRWAVQNHHRGLFCRTISSDSQLILYIPGKLVEASGTGNFPHTNLPAKRGQMINRRISIPDEVEVAFKNGERLSFTRVAAAAVGKKSGDSKYAGILRPDWIHSVNHEGHSVFEQFPYA